MNPNPQEAITWRAADIVGLHQANIDSEAGRFAVVEVIRDGRVIAILFPPDDAQEAAMRMAPLFRAAVVIVAMEADLTEHEEVQSEALLITSFSKDESAGLIVPFDRDFAEYRDPLGGDISGTHEEWVRSGFHQLHQATPTMSAVRSAFDISDFEARVREDCAVAKELIRAGVIVALNSEPGSEKIIEESFEDFDAQVSFPEPSFGPISMN